MNYLLFMLASIDCKLNKCPKNEAKVFKTIDLKRTACDFASKISQRRNPFLFSTFCHSRAKKHRVGLWHWDETKRWTYGRSQLNAGNKTIHMHGRC
ncbi:hypothetical protein D917_07715 [Trichinella nativa]|uniref:Uncharacterized protein n=1 Tax=Trichinella nativa TaxID=6335 RepID=A0A1Y3ERR2_9BILA|nr:hypothetical protein D917_07715 [Trichinella nativa]